MKGRWKDNERKVARVTNTFFYDPGLDFDGGSSFGGSASSRHSFNNQGGNYRSTNPRDDTSINDVSFTEAETDNYSLQKSKKPRNRTIYNTPNGNDQKPAARKTPQKPSSRGKSSNHTPRVVTIKRPPTVYTESRGEAEIGDMTSGMREDADDTDYESVREYDEPSPKPRARKYRSDLTAGINTDHFSV